APAKRRQRLADELFVGERAVDLGGVEERHAAFDRPANQRDHRFAIGGRTVAEAHSHAAEPERRHFETAVSQLARLHGLTPLSRKPCRWRTGISLSSRAAARRLR